jgi:hypothetical protein
MLVVLIGSGPTATYLHSTAEAFTQALNACIRKKKTLEIRGIFDPFPCMESAAYLDAQASEGD